MPRSRNVVASKARKKKIFKLAKGFFGRRKNVWRVAKNAVEKALQYSYIHRKTKKRESLFNWVGPLSGNKYVLVTYKGGPKVKSLKEIGKPSGFSIRSFALGSLFNIHL